ncbi:MAG TPA: peptidoglycan-binding protein [Mycobacteriales bacterium]|nr:peptidoglycan-binding protein [Mycobacteriales bacterium]
MFGPGQVAEDVRVWQARMAERGWDIQVDGIYGPQTARIAAAFQAEKGLVVDGLVGPETWAAAWTAPIT